MKQVKAIINPHKLPDVREALSELGDFGLTVTDVKGYGRQKGHKEIYRGAEYDIQFVPKTVIEMVVTDEQLEEVSKTIIEAARTSKIGDGKIFVSHVETAVRIRTGEKDEQAL